MAEPFIAISTVSHGSMRNRKDPLDADVIAHREAWLKNLGINISQTTRVNISFVNNDDYCRYRHVGELEMGQGMYDDDVLPADALITTTPGHTLFLPVADCVATTIYDEENNVLMLTHLGRQSLEQQGGFKSIEHLQNHYGSDPKKLKIWLSPTVNKAAYPIFKLDNMGMKEALYEQFKEAGVPLDTIIDNKEDTATNPQYYSYSEFLKGNKPEDGSHAMVATLPGGVQ